MTLPNENEKQATATESMAARQELNTRARMLELRVQAAVAKMVTEISQTILDAILEEMK